MHINGGGGKIESAGCRNPRVVAFSEFQMVMEEKAGQKRSER
jgi:hypothetical protein